MKFCIFNGAKIKDFAILLTAVRSEHLKRTNSILNIMNTIEYLTLTKMKNFGTILSALFALTFLVSCDIGQTEKNKTAEQETPQALQEDNIVIKSYSRTGDLIEVLYQELVDKNPELKALEEDLDVFRPKSQGITDKFNQYNYKSNTYYSAANNKASEISDSLLKTKIISLLTKSNDKYSTKTAELNSLLKQISKNKATLNDHHTVLKIVLTLPLIEKYQNDHKPNKVEFNDMIKQQEKLILQTDSLIPSY